MEENKQEVALEVVQPEVQAQPEPQNSTVQNNLVAMRKKLEAEEYARRVAERRAQEAEQRVQSYQQPTQQPPEDDDIAIDNEDYVQAKHIKSSNNKFKNKLSSTEKKLAELEQKYSYLEAKVDTDGLKDFNEVVSDDNLATLARLYPDDYQTMMANPNLKSKSKTAYNMIKNYGILPQKEQRVDTNDLERRLNANKLKPQAAASQSPQAAATPLANLGEFERRVLSDADRDRIMAEVNRKKMIG